MNKSIIILLLCFSPLSVAFSQQKTDFSRPDLIAKTAPDSVENSILTLSDYFTANLHSKKELIRAFYYWTANEIVYDVENMYLFRSADEPGKVIIQALRERKAVCQGYSEVFHELCENAGIESHVVSGYTRQNGNVVNITHAWVAARIDSAWYLFDPTWGSGFVMNGKFTRKFTGEYFKVRPDIFIKSHMPFDPLWQFLWYPLNSGDFIRGTQPDKGPGNFFAFSDSIAAYEQLTKADQNVATLRRVEKSGVNNNSIFEYVRYLKQNIEIERANRQNEIQNQKVARFNEAVNHFNMSSNLFNDYIMYWNRQFKPTRPDAAIRKMIDTCNYHLAESRKILEEIIPQEETLRQNKEILIKAVRDNQRRVDEQSAFLADYFATSKAFRPTLFRKYTWLGVPVK